MLSDFVDVVHTVGPQGEFADELKSCYASCIDAVTENSLKSVVRQLFNFISAQHIASHNYTNPTFQGIRLFTNIICLH